LTPTEREKKQGWRYRQTRQMKKTRQGKKELLFLLSLQLLTVFFTLDFEFQMLA